MTEQEFEKRVKKIQNDLLELKRDSDGETTIIFIGSFLPNIKLGKRWSKEDIEKLSSSPPPTIFATAMGHEFLLAKILLELLHMEEWSDIREELIEKLYPVASLPLKSRLTN